MPDGGAPDTAVTTGELHRGINLIRADIAKIKNDTATKESVDNLKQRVVDLEGTLTWALRLGIPGLCVVALNAVNTFGGAVSK